MLLKLQNQLLNFKSFKLNAGLLYLLQDTLAEQFSTVILELDSPNITGFVLFQTLNMTSFIVKHKKVALLKPVRMKNSKNKWEKFWHLVGVELNPNPTFAKLFNWIATTARHFFEMWIKFLIIFKLENEFTTNGIY